MKLIIAVSPDLKEEQARDTSRDSLHFSSCLWIACGFGCHGSPIWMHDVTINRGIKSDDESSDEYELMICA